MIGRGWKDIFKVAFTFSGTLIGAGFASGQELLQFFITYGNMGFCGIALSGVLFAGFGCRLLLISQNRRLCDCAGLMRCLCGAQAGRFFESVIAGLLFTVLVLMLTAAGTIGAELFDLPSGVGCALLAGIILCAARCGIDSIARLNSGAMPFLTLVILIVSLSSLEYHQYAPELFFAAPRQGAQPAPHWILSCILYVSYNLVLSATVLVPLGRSIRRPQAIRIGSVLGGLLLTGLSFLIVLTMLMHYPKILSAQIPMLLISCTQDRLHAGLYTAAFTAALVTTSTACLYGCAVKLRKWFALGNAASLILTLAAAACCTRIGFSQLIGVAFPGFGYLSVWILIRLLFSRAASMPDGVVKDKRAGRGD